VPVAAFLVSAAAFLSAFLGGFVALRAVSRVGIIIAIGAGIRIGAAFFDLIPEAVHLVGGALDQVMLATAFGFLAFYVIEKYIDPAYRFSGLGSLVVYIVARRRRLRRRSRLDDPSR
jgi:ZIP family zinc transporter